MSGNIENEFGVCRLSLVTVRAEPDDKAEQVTQLLFGDHYEVLENTRDAKWIRIRIHFDQYEGWIDAKQHHQITREHFDYINRADFKIATDLTTSILYNKIPLLILMGSVLPISGSELFRMEEQFAFNGNSKSLGQKRDAEFLKNIALKYLNAPYQWGGRSPFGIDCSGLVQVAFRISGYSLARDVHQQAKQGKAVGAIDRAAPGDLLFFKGKEGKISHVGILLERDKVIHASGKVRIDHVDDEGILNLDTKVYTHSFAHARNVITPE